MLPWAAASAATAIVFIGLDGLWLSLMGPRLYKPALQDLLGGAVRPAPAVLFYLFYIAAVLLLAVLPGVTAGRWGACAWRTAILALAAYGAYDLTNQATLRVWPVAITCADLGWGLFASLAAASAGFFVSRAFA